MDYSQLAGTLLNTMTQQPQQPKRQIITVNGVAEARSFNISAGENVVLIDANADYFYIKECDDIGKSTLHAYKYEEIELTDEGVNGVTKKEFTQLSNDVAQLKDMIKELNNGQLNSKKSKAADNNTGSTE